MEKLERRKRKMNNVKIETEDLKVKVYVDDKEVKGIEKLVLTLEAGAISTLEIKQFVGNINLDVKVDEVKELQENNSIEQK